MITVGEEIYLIGEGSSTANLEVGDTLSVRQLLSGLLISSGNDAAYTLAVNVGRQELDEVVTYEEAIAYFVACMNENVETMGLTNTHFNSPDGYDADNQYISAEDLAMIAYEAYENEEIRTICSTHSLYVKEKDITWTSTNQLMNPDSQYYYDKAIGMKTGSTGNAGKCLVSVAQSGEQVYLCVVLNSDDSGRWLDSIALLDYGFGL
jgi:D-alanyl-D-alanine carboxypeptidase (penicillin-binding protein 5/6)